MYRFLWSPRWLGFAVFVLALAGVCVQLGVWQFEKLDERKADNEQVREHLAQDAVPLDGVVGRGDPVTDDLEWTRVSVRGTYDPEHQVTVKFVSRDSRPGVDVVTPLVLEDGTAVLVDRGFFPVERRNNQRPENVPAAADGTVEVSGWLRVDNGAGASATEVSDGQVRAVSSTGLDSFVPYELRSGYIDLQEQSPAPPEELAPEPTPDLGQGPHFFYGLQWFFFALLAAGGYVWFARAEAAQRRRPPATAPAQASETSSA